ncbi:MAG: class I SAM-dependent methyltransferase [Acidobacteria bacterium]|nr:class I SAM-dependent methyltransferase [Acidobacteriota bacterium]
MTFSNCYDDAKRAQSYAQLAFANTYHLAFRDLPQILAELLPAGGHALDFGCGTGRSTRFVRELGFETVGVDIAPEMVARARALDPGGDYRLARDDDFGEFKPASFDLVMSLFTFDNIPGSDLKIRLFRDLGALLKPAGKMVSVVSSPEIYLHEWASFSTKDYAAENRKARSGDTVRIVTTDLPDRRPAEDILCDDDSYRQIYAAAGLSPVATYKPLARGDEPYTWVNETKIAPWVIYVLGRA